jgi:predicted DNA-binding transcriptional regulator AlpA
MSLHADPIAYPPRGLSREETARYIGVSTFKLDQMIADRRMPGPRQIDGRVVWDKIEVDMAFSQLPYHGRANAFDSPK